MKFTNKLNLIIKIQLFICLVLGINFGFANTKGGPTSNSKLSATDVNNFNEKTKQGKKTNSSKNNSNNNFHEIMSTTGDCSASCCAGSNSEQRVGASKKKSNNQKGKKKFSWFSRSK